MRPASPLDIYSSGRLGHPPSNENPEGELSHRIRTTNTSTNVGTFRMLAVLVAEHQVEAGPEKNTGSSVERRQIHREAKRQEAFLTTVASSANQKRLLGFRDVAHIINLSLFNNNNCWVFTLRRTAVTRAARVAL